MKRNNAPHFAAATSAGTKKKMLRVPKRDGIPTVADIQTMSDERRRSAQAGTRRIKGFERARVRKG